MEVGLVWGDQSAKKEHLAVWDPRRRRPVCLAPSLLQHLGWLSHAVNARDEMEK